MRIGETELHRLHLQMLACDVIGTVAGQVEAVENAERNQCRDALSIRWNFVNGDAAIIERERFDPFAFVRGKIVRGMRPAVCARMCGHRRCERSEERRVGKECRYGWVGGRW